jgi:hypothetical protein
MYIHSWDNPLTVPIICTANLLSHLDCPSNLCCPGIPVSIVHTQMSMLMRQQLRLQHGKVALSRAAACPRRRLACSARAGE